MKIVLDIYGGDNAPDAIFDGAIEALKENDKIELVLVGKQEYLTRRMESVDENLKSRIELAFAEEVIENEEHPSTAVRRKLNSSIVVGCDLCKTRDDCGAFVSAGSSGAVLTGALLKIGRIKGVLRPTLISTFPTVVGGKVLLADSGANVDCKPEYLKQFAIIANEYAKHHLGLEKPRVGLLNVGVEPGKGNEVAKAVYEMLKELPINFIGNVEAREYLSGNVDIIISDGFAGNMLMKGTEGAGMHIMKMIKEAIYGSTRGKIGGLFLKKPMMKIKNMMDYSNYGGANFLGCSKLVVKCHGSSKPRSIKLAIIETYNTMLKNIQTYIDKAINEVDISAN